MTTVWMSIASQSMMTALTVIVISMSSTSTPLFTGMSVDLQMVTFLTSMPIAVMMTTQRTLMEMRWKAIKRRR